jgi:hypothetical protein
MHHSTTRKDGMEYRRKKRGVNSKKVYITNVETLAKFSMVLQ